ncbi:hypothetical protein [Enterobacter mori]|nr:hypothetical protein [Enterobacter mori]
MYGTREALCEELARMFTHDEPLALLVWTDVNAKIVGRFSPFLMSAIGH